MKHMSNFFQRFIRLNIGLIVFGFALALMLEARLGLGPWDILHQGISIRTDISSQIFGKNIDLTSVGMISIIVGAVIMILWLPLKERPGIGTILNVIVIGIMIDVWMFVLPNTNNLIIRFLMILIAPILVALGTILYIGAEMGPGPRDGLMTGLAKRGIPIAVARTSMESIVLIAGFILGGNIGIGTIWFAFSIGPFIQLIIQYKPLSSILASEKFRKTYLKKRK